MCYTFARQNLKCCPTVKHISLDFQAPKGDSGGVGLFWFVGVLFGWFGVSWGLFCLVGLVFFLIYSLLTLKSANCSIPLEF